MKRAWYLGHSASDIGGSAILVGDPARVDRIAQLLDAPKHLPVSRGLRTVTGNWNGKAVTVASFGMGAPIAVIVLHELADLGVKRFLRIGTAMHFPPAAAGELLASAAALPFDGTSPSYREGSGPIPADPGLVASISKAAAVEGSAARACLFASFDAFYRDMFGIDDAGRRQSRKRKTELARLNVAAIDMETSALLAASLALKVKFASLCVASVDAVTSEKLERGRFAAAETQLFRVALGALAPQP